MRWLLFCALSFCAGPAAAQIRSVTLQPPARDFGYFAGDLLTTTVRIATDPGTQIDANSLPPAGAVTAALELRRVTLAHTHQTSGEIFVIQLTYQTFLAAPEVARQTAPGFTVDFTSQNCHLTAPVGGFSISVSPFRHDLQPVSDVAAMRPGHAMASVISAWPARLIVLGLGIAVIGAALLSASGLLLLPGRKMPPFRAAARRIRLLAGHDQPQALMALHRALDETAGHPLFAEDLPPFLAANRNFAALHSDLAEFYARSRAIFFGPAAPHAHPDDGWLERLSQAMARAERGG